MALWIETVEPGKPLGFLDASIQCGDSLLGVFDLKALEDGIPDDAYKPLTGDDKDTARHFAARNRSEKRGQGRLDFGGGGGALPPARLATRMDDLRHLPEDTLAQIADKRSRFAAFDADPRRYATKVACDLYIAAFLLPKTGGVPASVGAALVPTTAHLRTRLGGGQIHGQLEAAAVDAAMEARAFHWPLAFPEVMIGRGGFDVVLGNPPWERIKLQEQEFFASRDSDIATAPNADARTARINALAKAEPGSPARQLHEAFSTAKRVAEASSVFFSAPKDQDPTKMDPARVSPARRYPWTGRGDVNTYALFAEHFLNLTNPRGGAGVIVPTGIATDATTAPFFGHLVGSRRLAGLVDFENSLPLFPGVHRSYKFALLTLGADVAEAGFAFFLTDPAQLDDPHRRFTLSPAQIAAINPNTKTAPVFRARRDADLTAQIYARVPVLIDEAKGAAGNPWGVSFMAMFHMSNDSGLFRTTEQLASQGWVRDGTDWVRAAGAAPAQQALALAGGRDARHLDLSAPAPRITRYVPLYEAKMIHQFDHRWATYVGEDSRDVTLTEKSDPAFEPAPRYWVPQGDVADRLAAKGWARGWLMGWRDICRATDERTVIYSFCPLVAVGHTMPLMFADAKLNLWAAIQANLGALTLDFVARQSVGGTHLTYGYLKQFPILPPTAYTDADLAFIVPRVLELTYVSHAMAPFARDLGHHGPPFAWDEARRAQLRAQLDAWYALAYGLTRDELRYVLDPRDVMGPDYPSETFRVLQNNERARHGEYRTRRLVLEAYDTLLAQGHRVRTEGYRT